jgi:hypothetical protein
MNFGPRHIEHERAKALPFESSLENVGSRSSARFLVLPQSVRNLRQRRIRVGRVPVSTERRSPQTAPIRLEDGRGEYLCERVRSLAGTAGRCRRNRHCRECQVVRSLKGVLGRIVFSFSLKMI